MKVEVISGCLLAWYQDNDTVVTDFVFSFTFFAHLVHIWVIKNVFTPVLDSSKQSTLR